MGINSKEAREASRRRMTGAGCPRWNGGRTTTGNRGRYIAVKAPSDYPFPDSVNRRGYIREHRMVMELHLGRALLPSEVVHHRNHDTRDNRVENLEIHAAHGEHMSEEWRSGTFERRWPLCIFGCGRQAKPHQGRRLLACHRCRAKAANRQDPRCFAVEESNSSRNPP